MKVRRSFLICLGLLLFLTSPVLAQSEVIKSFDAQITAGSDGVLEITETLEVDFGTIDHHGIFRYIPTVTKVGDLYRVTPIQVSRITRDGKKEPFTTSNQNQQVYLKIGDPDVTVTKNHLYQISYTVKNAVGSNYNDHDEIYWNITGNEWEWPIEKATATLNAPVALKEATCFTGAVGSTFKACSSTGNKFQTNSSLLPGDGLTIVASYPVGTFPKSLLQKNKPGSLDGSTLYSLMVGVLIIIIFLNLILPLRIWRWYQGNRNSGLGPLRAGALKRKYGPPVVNFDFPEGLDGKRLTPLEAGIMDTGSLDRDDVLATLYDLAIRKYIKLEQTKKDKKILGLDVGDKEEFVVKKLRDYSDLKPFEKTLLDRLFEGGDSVEISSLKTDFYKTFQAMEEDSFRELVSGSFYTKNPKTQRGLFFTGGLLSFFILAPVLGVIMFYLAWKLNGRTELGDKTDWQIDGLKLFLQGRSREYDWNTKNLHVVEGMIPYAMALGFIEKFMKEFQIHYPDYNPSWYSGYSGSNFTLANAAFISSFSSNITTSAPSSSSGFSSGGSSGGGGGGGGGGGW